MDRLTAMRSFVEVADCASFTQAAEQLNLSRLQVSRHVKELEQWLNLRLLHRTTRSVSLTLEGEETLSYCQEILSGVAQMQSRAQQHNTKLVGTIRLASPIGLGQHKLFDVVNEFIALHPNVKFQFVLADSLAAMVGERVDIALRYTHQPDDNLIARRLMQIDSVICAAPEYLEHHEPIINIADIGRHNCLVHTSQSQWHWLIDNQHQQLNVGGNLQANDMGVLIKAALLAKGLVCLPADLANPYLADGQLIEVLPQYVSPGKPLWAVYLSRSYQLLHVRAFIDFIAQKWQQDITKWQT
ncbi:transcriptional regulator [Shewanella denitrificans OS217]|uniref:Transcriptional regulator n=1 Tax=Shewanella denitrificans (strain OS217 / ATCC BAA-1090 / DSM 15013) TaxID=318161 RepID=Q12K54_SHEDO|nr:LysR family transcriptional regulator [Shewanella denitrificans]ABE56172.1 transcriptional regulator [Shewanella denitrificans OS217]